MHDPEHPPLSQREEAITTALLATGTESSRHAQVAETLSQNMRVLRAERDLAVEDADRLRTLLADTAMQLGEAQAALEQIHDRPMPDGQASAATEISRLKKIAREALEQ